VLRDVLGWEATECAELLDISVAATNSALQRARATLASDVARGYREGETPPTADAATAELLARYVRAWEHADINALVAILAEDATLAMPPMPQWFAGREAIAASIGDMVFAPAGKGVFRLVATEANGRPAFLAYRKDPTTATYRAFSLHILEARAGQITAIDAFLDPSVPAWLDMPAELGPG
jgi:RNA polymerase sigma-70 factor (ECF subfamily)